MFRGRLEFCGAWTALLPSLSLMASCFFCVFGVCRILGVLSLLDVLGAVLGWLSTINIRLLAGKLRGPRPLLDG